MKFIYWVDIARKHTEKTDERKEKSIFRRLCDFSEAVKKSIRDYLESI